MSTEKKISPKKIQTYLTIVEDGLDFAMIVIGTTWGVAVAQGWVGLNQQSMGIMAAFGAGARLSMRRIVNGIIHARFSESSEPVESDGESDSDANETRG